MAYNNNSNSGYNRGYSGGGQSRPPQRSGYGAQHGLQPAARRNSG